MPIFSGRLKCQLYISWAIVMLPNTHLKFLRLNITMHDTGNSCFRALDPSGWRPGLNQYRSNILWTVLLKYSHKTNSVRLVDQQSDNDKDRNCEDTLVLLTWLFKKILLEAWANYPVWGCSEEFFSEDPCLDEHLFYSYSQYAITKLFDSWYS